MAKKTLAVETVGTVLDAFQAVIDDARAEFEAEKAEQAAAWKKELARKQEEDTYNFNISKRNREDALQAELAQRVSAVADREVKVKEREVVVGDSEKTIADLQATVNGIPALLDQYESVGHHKGQVDAKKDFDNELRLIQAENTAEKKILEHALTAIKGTVDTQVQTIDTLRQELAAANARVSEIATNAVTAAGQSKVTVNAAQQK